MKSENHQEVMQTIFGCCTSDLLAGHKNSWISEVVVDVDPSNEFCNADHASERYQFQQKSVIQGKQR